VHEVVGEEESASHHLLAERDDVRRPWQLPSLVAPHAARSTATRLNLVHDQIRARLTTA